MASVLYPRETIITIERHILEEQKYHPEATGVLTSLLYDLALVGKYIANKTTRASFADIIGTTKDINVQGEQVMKLDELADHTIFKLNAHTGRIAVMASEEQADIIQIPEKYPTGKYVLLYDPLDGSSNIDVNAPIGTIFSIQKRVSEPGPGTLSDCLQPGRNMVVGGYIIYGSSTMMVYTSGKGTHGFTLDPYLGEFLLTHPNIKIPEKPKYYSVNQGYQKYWSEGMRRYTNYLQGLEEDRKPLSLRYIGSLVADFHRNLLSGGIFYYPLDSKDPKLTSGKLRLLYEANPLSFVCEQAGGYASNGHQRVLEIVPESIHQRTPLFIGNRELVEKAEEYLKKYG